MAKRSNPFTEEFIQQSKVHVGLKQFNNNEERLQTVYAKTLEMLFNGAKKSSQDTVPSNTTTLHQGNKDKMKQLFIGNDGALLHSGTIMAHATENQFCLCSNPIESLCGYCEVGLCLACQHLCLSCNHSYCTGCSLMGSEGEFCVSCYG